MELPLYDCISHIYFNISSHFAVAPSLPCRYIAYSIIHTSAKDAFPFSILALASLASGSLAAYTLVDDYNSKNFFEFSFLTV